MRPALAALLLFLSSCSRSHAPLAGFEGRITLHRVEARKTSDVTVTVKGERARIDVPPPDVRPAVPEVTLGHAVYDHATTSVRLFFDTTKEYRDMDLSKRIAKEPPPSGLESMGSKVIAGYPCSEWSTAAPDGGQIQACLVQGVPYLEIFRVQFGPHGTESPLAREFRENTTFPLAIVEVDGEGKERARMEVTKIARGPVDDEVFAVPAGYVKVDPHFGPPTGSSGRPERH